MEGMHDGDSKFPITIANLDHKDHFDRLSLEAGLVDTFDMPKKINRDFLIVNNRLNNGGLRGVVIRIRDQDSAIKCVRQLCRRRPAPKIVDVF